MGLARRFSVSGWLPDIRRYGSTYFNYTGQAALVLLSPRRSSPTTPTTRCGSRSATRAPQRSWSAFADRFGVEVIDAFGATEGGVAVNRDAEARAGALGQVGDNVQVVDDDGHELSAGPLRRPRACS